MPDPIPINHNVGQRSQFEHPPAPHAPRPQVVRPWPAPAQHIPVAPRFQPAPARPVAVIPRTPTPSRRDPWDHKAAAMTIGAFLYGVADYYIDSLFVQSTNLVNHLWFSIQLGSYTYTLTTGSILIAVLFAIPLFFGAAFGARVGLLVGVIGSLAGDCFAAHAFGFTLDWHWWISMGLIGFFACIAPFRTRRRYPALVTTFFATIVGTLAIAIGIGGAAFSTSWSLNTVTATNLFIEFAPDALFAIIFFSFLLFVYNAIVGRR